jgi:hypothetical protein
VRRKTLDEVDGWAEWCITEDAELGLRIFERGESATYIARSYGKGLMPDTFLDFKKQRFRWAYGAVLIMRQHIGALLGGVDTKLTPGQRYHFIAGWLPWLADGLNLIFNFAAIVWSLMMIYFPADVAPPNIAFAVLPLVFFVFKITKMMMLYRRRVSANLRQSLAAGLAGLALSHVIARAMLAGFVTSKIGFFRTPKQASNHGIWQALMDAREELLIYLALALSAVGVIMEQDNELLDVQVWCLVLTVQSLPYLASVLVAVISGLPKLPASLVGTLGTLRDEKPSA